MNLLKKTTPWVVASLLTMASAFAENQDLAKNDKCRPVCPPCSTPCDFKEMMPGMPGYNAPSRVNVCGNWDMYADASFIYWQVAQDNMAYALTNTNTHGQITNPGTTGNYVQMDFDYKPGFKVGGGINFDHDNWDSSAEYTRLHGTNSASTNGPAGGFLFANWGSPSLLSLSQAFSSASSSFKTNLDTVDWVFGRNFFVGKNLTFHPVLGARGAWITQAATVHYRNSASSGLTGAAGSVSSAAASSLDVYSRVHSWAVGPRTGVEGNWMIGQGLRFFGNGYADLLYTNYKLQNKSVYTPYATGITRTVHSKGNVGAIRTHLDLELGLGWGSYFDDNNWHVDLSAGYGFQVFFNQNMFRQSFDDVVISAGSNTNGDMTIQGLTVTARFDF